MASVTNVDRTNSETNHLNSPIREELVNTAIKFLQNPKVINSSLAQKQNFLQRRGLSDEEIRIACEKSGAYTHHEQQLSSPSPPYSYSLNPYQKSMSTQITLFDKVRDLVQNIALFSIVAYVLHKFYEKYIAPFLFGRKKKSVEDKIGDLEKNVENSINDIKISLNDVKSEVNKITFYTEDDMVSQLKNLQSEVATVKGLLLTRKQFPSVANSPVVPPSIPAWQLSSVHQQPEQEGDSEETKEELLEFGSGSGSSEHEHGMKTSESSLEIICSARDYDTESCHSKKSSREESIPD
ncbi:peroxisomal membrane protein PEX14 isoform X1 [Sitophilus oryzae]|uniref:Peroxisomal membrane protein PEX14 n=1 Tax=Sitophilus oryzae TaxID=7048 RepID=A0A6J2XSV5_SITOR|nr:peroxisomal membrane protein PEX14 isoform X1 [Sitophilus oryzae]